MYVSIKNKAGNFCRYFATSEERAIELAVRHGHARNPENAKISFVQSVCDTCFPNEGWAVLELEPNRGYKSVTVDGPMGGTRQHSDELHDECHGALMGKIDHSPLNYGAFTPTGFANMTIEQGEQK